jgi:hypothetical protein
LDKQNLHVFLVVLEQLELKGAMVQPVGLFLVVQGLVLHMTLFITIILHLIRVLDVLRLSVDGIVVGAVEPADRI